MADNDSIGTRSFRKGDPVLPGDHPAAHSTPRSHLTTDSLARLPRTKIAENEPDWQVPDLPAAIGRFQVLDLLGHGGFGFVYRAYDPDLNRQVALKVPRAGAVTEQFLEEARAAAQLKHPNIVTIYDVGRSADGQVFIAMEYVDGPNLAAWATANTASPQQTAEVVAKVAEAVHFAHKAGFVHRDLKPGNILIDRDGTPKVADFGLALHESQQHLKQGEVVGTPAFMAPEQITGTTQQIDGRTDIWALGVILYRLLSGRQPFDGTRGDLKEQVLHCDPKPLRQIDDSIPPALDELCRQCLAKSPAGRPATALDVNLALESFLHSTTASQSTPLPFTTGPTPETGTSRGRAVPAAIGVCLLFVAGWATHPMWSGATTPDTPGRLPEQLPKAVPEEQAAVVATAAQRVLNDDTSPVLHPPGPEWRALPQRVAPVLWWTQDVMDSWAFDKKTGRIAVRCRGQQLLRTSTAQAEDVSLQSVLKLDGWNGRAGIAWGVQEHVDGTHQCLFVRIGRATPTSPWEVQVGELQLRETGIGQPPMLGSVETLDRIWFAHTIDAPDDPECLLQVDLKDGVVQSVRVDGEVFISDTQLKHLPIPRLAVAGRGIGLLAEHGTILFKSFWIRE